MIEKGKTAIIVVDMLNDFVTGALKCDRGLAIVPHVKKLWRKMLGHPLLVAQPIRFGFRYLQNRHTMLAR